MYLVPGHQITEVTGVRLGFRRYCKAGPGQPRLVQEAFDAGVTLAALMAAHEEEVRNLYTRAGANNGRNFTFAAAPVNL
jgi:hypothetical protein